MPLLQNLIHKWKENKEEKEDFERRERMVDRFESKKLKSDERELMRFHEEDRQKEIKEELAKRRKQMNEETWDGRTGNPIFTPNIITEQKDLFKNEGNLFNGKSNLFNQHNSFFRR